MFHICSIKDKHFHHQKTEVEGLPSKLIVKKAVDRWTDFILEPIPLGKRRQH